MPVEVGRAYDGTGIPRHETRDGHREAGRPQALGLRLGDDLPHQAGELLEHRLR